MGWSRGLKAVSIALLIVFPVSLFAGETTATAMLYARGETFLNGSAVPRSSALFSGDLVQTEPDSVANINATGSTILVLNDSLLRYQEDALELEHGGVRVSTSRSVSAQAGDVKVSPSTSSVTEFEIRDVDGKVRIAALRGSLTVKDHDGTTVLAQGQETSRDETPATDEKRKKKDRRSGGTLVPAQRPLLDSPWVVGIGGGAIIGLTTWVLIKSDDPVSDTRIGHFNR